MKQLTKYARNLLFLYDEKEEQLLPSAEIVLGLANRELSSGELKHETIRFILTRDGCFELAKYLAEVAKDLNKFAAVDGETEKQK